MVSTLNPTVGIVFNVSSNFSLYKIVDLPAKIQINPFYTILWLGLFTSYSCNIRKTTWNRKLVIWGHLTSSRYQFMPISNFSGRIISFLSIFPYLRNVKHAISKRNLTFHPTVPGNECTNILRITQNWSY